jgi:aspartyl protease family protein
MSRPGLPDRSPLVGGDLIAENPSNLARADAVHSRRRAAAEPSLSPVANAMGVLAIVCALTVVAAPCLATQVDVVAVTPGLRADVSIDGADPITLDIGETAEGVTLLEVNRADAVLRVDGMRTSLPLVAKPAEVAGAARSDTVVLSADPRGHFYASGTVNGRSMRFLVDTGATLTTLSRMDARRLGLDYRSGTPSKVMTGSGEVSGWRVSLDSVRVGPTTVRDVEAFVVDNDALPVGLLGMSFLGRFDMHRQGATLVLRHH